MGFNTNNAAESEGMIVGLTIVDRKGLLLVIVEGDSAIILTLAAKLLYGTLVSKLTNSWHLAHGISYLASLLQRMHATTFHHMRRKANALDDFLANSGMNSPHTLVEGTLQDSLDSQVWTKSIPLASSDLSLLDAGDNSGDSCASFRPS